MSPTCMLCGAGIENGLWGIRYVLFGGGELYR